MIQCKSKNFLNRLFSTKTIIFERLLKSVYFFVDKLITFVHCFLVLIQIHLVDQHIFFRTNHFALTIHLVFSYSAITSCFCSIEVFSQSYRSNVNYHHDPFIKYLALESKIIKIIVTNVWIGNSLKWSKTHSGKRVSFTAVKP